MQVSDSLLSSCCALVCTIRQSREGLLWVHILYYMNIDSCSWCNIFFLCNACGIIFSLVSYFHDLPVLSFPGFPIFPKSSETWKAHNNIPLFVRNCQHLFYNLPCFLGKFCRYTQCSSIQEHAFNAFSAIWIIASPKVMPPCCPPVNHVRVFYLGLDKLV